MVSLEEPQKPVVERGYVPVIYSSRVIRVERVGDNLLLVFGFDTLDERGKPIIEVVAKVMRPASSMLGAARLLALAQRHQTTDVMMN